MAYQQKIHELIHTKNRENQFIHIERIRQFSVGTNPSEWPLKDKKYTTNWIKAKYQNTFCRFIQGH